jgi:hypothetical protein
MTPIAAIILGAGLFPGLARVEIRWAADKTESSIKLHIQGHDFEIKPNTVYQVPLNVLEVMEQSTYSVEFRALIEHDADDGMMPDDQDTPVAPVTHHELNGSGGA